MTSVSGVQPDIEPGCMGWRSFTEQSLVAVVQQPGVQIAKGMSDLTVLAPFLIPLLSSSFRCHWWVSLDGLTIFAASSNSCFRGLLSDILSMRALWSAVERLNTADTVQSRWK